MSISWRPCGAAKLNLWHESKCGRFFLFRTMDGYVLGDRVLRDVTRTRTAQAAKAVAVVRAEPEPGAWPVVTDPAFIRE